MRNLYNYSTKEIYCRLFKIATPLKCPLILSTVFSILGNMAQLSLMAGGALWILYIGNQIDFGRPSVFLIAISTSGFTIVICRYLEGIVSHKAAYTLLATLRIRIFNTIRRLAPACLMDKSKGDLVNIAISDIETIEFFFAHTIGPIFTVILLPCVTLSVAAAIHPLFTIILLPIYILISIIFPLIAVKTGRGVGLRYREALGQLKAVIMEGIYGLQDVLIFGYGEQLKEKVYDENNKVNKGAYGLTMHRQIVSSAPVFFIYLARILIIAVASYLLSGGNNVSAGTILLSFLAVASFSSTFSLMSVVSSLLETFGAAQRLFALEDTEPEVDQITEPIYLGPIETIEFQNTCFSYEKHKNPVLKNFNLKISKGEKIGIVGESGIGKSTVARLLLRFWNSTDGTIKINGISIEKTSIKEVHRRIALLEQDTFIFEDTIAGNISLGNKNASKDQVIIAAKKAGIHSFIETLPLSYDTPMGQLGHRLSGGEKQRIGIARIMLMNPDVLIMDEPTASLDSLHEKELLNTLEKEYLNKTIIIISHRMSTLTGCDRIVKMEKVRP